MVASGIKTAVACSINHFRESRYESILVLHISSYILMVNHSWSSPIPNLNSKVLKFVLNLCWLMV